LVRLASCTVNGRQTLASQAVHGRSTMIFPTTPSLAPSKDGIKAMKRLICATVALSLLGATLLPQSLTIMADSAIGAGTAAALARP
jgi:hypothetical protein